MSLGGVFETADVQARGLDESGRWCGWVAAQPDLAAVGSAAQAVEVVWDRRRPGEANAVLAALVRVGSVDAGVDEGAVEFVCALLAPGAGRLAGSLRRFGPDAPQMVAAQLWLQVRQYPWRRLPRAVASNVLLQTRRAVLRDFGANGGPALVPLTDARLQWAASRAGEPAGGAGDAELLGVLTWARACKVLDEAAIALLWDLVMVAADADSRQRRFGATGDRACERVAAVRGVSGKTVRRHRDEAVHRLRVSVTGGEVPRTGVSR